MATGSVILAGDFNARALEWGMPTTNPRGRMVLEMATRCNLVVQNRGNRPTYERAGWGASIPDITFATEGASRRIGDWRVMAIHTMVAITITSPSGCWRVPHNDLRAEASAGLECPKDGRGQIRGVSSNRVCVHPCLAWKSRGSPRG